MGTTKFQQITSFHRSQTSELSKKIIRNGNRIGIKYYIFPLVDNGSIKSFAEENILIKETIKLLQLLNKKALILFMELRLQERNKKEK